MRISTMIRFTPSEGPQDRLLDRVADYARRIEAAGFPGIWVGDSLGRGRPTLDPLMELSILAAVTRKVELSIGVLQIPLRHPIELAHRVGACSILVRTGYGEGEYLWNSSKWLVQPDFVAADLADAVHWILRPTK